VRNLRQSTVVAKEAEAWGVTSAIFSSEVLGRRLYLMQG
jgi:hypothetical protein